VIRDPPPAEQFDLVHARLVLVHLTDRAAAMRTMIDALRPGGWLVIEDGDRGDHRAVAVDGPVVLADTPPPRLLDMWLERHGSRAEWAAAWFELRRWGQFTYRQERSFRR